jgi:redox-sensitive bicupin YhaK (pirin superfamily)
MTAGSGVVHEEFHGRAVAAAGGTVSMAQLWVNLPATHKMTRPRYQPILAADIPVVRRPGGHVRVIAGPWSDGTEEIRGPAETYSPLAVFDVRLDPGASLTAPLPDGWSTMVAVLAGEVTLGGERLTAPRTAVLGRNGDDVTLSAGEAGAAFLVLAGEPIDEPIAAYGPFVMNTREEIRTAIADYEAGRMGRLDPR